MLFSRWGRFVYRFRRPVALIAVVLGLLAVPFAAQTSSELSSGGWLDRDADSAIVADRLAAEFGAGRSNLIVLYRTTDGTTVTSPETMAAIATSLTDVRQDDLVTGIVGYAETGDARFVSADGSATYVIVELNLSNEDSVAAVDPLRAEFRPNPGLSYELTGYGPVTKDSAEQSEVDLQRAETVSLPIAAVILIVVFASLVAAGMPLLVAGLAIPTSLALIYLIAQQVEMSVFVLNIATMLGLALAIDYSLFIVSRFREELGRGRSVGDSVERAVATSGKAVAFSGMAVAIGLSGLLVFEAPALRSIGIAGSVVVFCSVLYALTFLPAILGMLGHRVNALTFHGLARRIRPSLAPRVARPSRWEGIARWVMRRPVLVLVPTLVILLAAGTPFLRLQQGVPGAEIYPAGLESRDAYVALQTEFPRGETTPIVVLADVSGSPTDPANALALARYGAALAAIDGIDRVEGAFSLTDQATGAPMTPEAIAQLWSTPRDQLPPDLAAGLDRLAATYIRGSTVRFDAISPVDAAQPAAGAMIPVIRALQPGDGIRTLVGGTAALGHDFLVSQGERAPFGVGIPLFASGLILFLLFGSVILPAKAILMTLLSISASFGALVWIFQDGNLSSVLSFHPLGFTIAGNPIIMFCVLFGLSMDYEVLLLSRIQEAYRRTGDNTAAVAEGLVRTAGMITGAAAVMISVFAAFALADIITIKSIGVGMAIAVFIDATIIRVLLVPAAMRLLGRWNWWAPGPLGRLADRLGFSHVEDDGDGSKRPIGDPSTGLARP